MRIIYGSYEIPVGLATATVRRVPVWNDARQRVSVQQTLNISGMLQGTDDSELLTYKRQLEAAFARDGLDFRMLTSNGVEMASIRAADNFDGPRVMSGPNYDDGRPIDYIRSIGFKIELYAETRPQNTGGPPGGLNPGSGANGGNTTPGIEDVGGTAPPETSSEARFEQSVAYTGTGGPRFVVVETMLGAPIVQRVNARTVCRAVQSGSMAWRGVIRPTPPAPFWREWEQVSQRSIRHYQSGATLACDWQYVFEAPQQLR